MAQEQPAGFEVLADRVHIAAVVFRPHMFQHTHAGYRIEVSLHLTVVLQADFYWQVLAMGLGIVFLLL